MNKGGCNVAGQGDWSNRTSDLKTNKHINCTLFQEIALGILMKLDHEFIPFYDPNYLHFKKTN